jgi:hypothetical protein
MKGRCQNASFDPAISSPSFSTCRASRTSITDVRTGFRQFFSAG